MERPEISVENHEAVNKYYEQIQPNRFAARALHAIAAKIYKPRVHYEEDAEAEVAELSPNTRLLVAGNHIFKSDQLPVASIVRTEKPLHRMAGNTFIPAKAPYFQKKWKSFLFEKLGAIPVFRQEDVSEDPILQGKAAKSFINTCVKKLINGQNMFIFPEGTRNKNKKNPEEIGPLFGGIGRIACGAAKETDVAIMVMGIWYGKGIMRYIRWRKPDIYISRLIKEPFESKQAVNKNVEEKLTYSVAKAVQKGAERTSVPFLDR